MTHDLLRCESPEEIRSCATSLSTRCRCSSSARSIRLHLQRTLTLRPQFGVGEHTLAFTLDSSLHHRCSKLFLKDPRRRDIRPHRFLVDNGSWSHHVRLPATRVLLLQRQNSFVHVRSDFSILAEKEKRGTVQIRDYGTACVHEAEGLASIQLRYDRSDQDVYGGLCVALMDFFA